MADSRSAYSCWIKRGEDVYLPSDNVQVVDSIEAGAYKVSFSNRDESYIVSKVKIKTDDLVNLPQPEMQEVMGAVDDFYTQQKEFAKWGFIFKRGFLLYGVPGGGKTSIISNIMNYVIDKMNGLVFLVYNTDDLHYYSGFMSRVFRNIEPDRLILVIFEDIDSMTKEETLLINVLDGLGNSHNVLNIATTNYTERLSERLLNRPNRFDRRWEIKSPSYEARRQFFIAKILPDALKTINLNKWVQDTEGFTIAQLSEVIKSVFLLKQSFPDTLALLKNMKKVPDSSTYNKETSAGLGFGFGSKPPRMTEEPAIDPYAEDEELEGVPSSIPPHSEGLIDLKNGTGWYKDPLTGERVDMTPTEVADFKREMDNQDNIDN